MSNKTIYLGLFLYLDGDNDPTFLFFGRTYFAPWQHEFQFWPGPIPGGGGPKKVCHTMSHCSKSSFFVQKFNFDFPRKLSIFFWWKTRENVVVLDFLAVDNFDFTKKIVKKNLSENSWKCWGLRLFSCWQLWFHEKNCQKIF